MSRGLLHVCWSLLLLVAAGPQARAEGGVLNAYSIAPPPPGFALRLTLSDDSPANLAIFERFSEALKARGHILDKASPIRLDLDPQLVESGLEGGGAASDRRDQWTDINSFSGKTLETFQQAERRPSVAHTSRLVLTATLTDSASGQVLWQGTAEAPTQGGDPAPLGRRLAPPLAAALGTTVRGQPIELGPR